MSGNDHTNFRLVILGAGGLAAEIQSLVLTLEEAGANIEYLGCVAPECHREDLDYLGDTLEEGFASHFVLGVGDIAIRKKCIDQANYYHLQPLSLIHPSCHLGHGIEVGEGVVIMQGASLTAAITLGDHVLVQSSSIISHDCEIESNVNVCPGATLGGGVIVESNTLLGLNATLLPKVRIPKGSIIAAGATIVHSPEQSGTYIGVV